MHKKEAIALKGCRDGVKVLISKDADIREILDALHEKAREYRSFFKGSCNVIVTGREFSQSDKLRINSVMSTILPECPLSFQVESVEIAEKEEKKGYEGYLPDEDIFKDEKRKSPGIQKAILKFFGAGELEEDEAFDEYTEPEEKTYEPDRMIEVRGRLLDNTYIYKGDVRRNNRLRAPGNLLVLGDVDKNAEVVAIGSIYVFGKVRGRIWAGCNGDDEASIIANGLMPDEMRISDVYLRLPNANSRIKNRPERAYLLNNTICIDEY